MKRVFAAALLMIIVCAAFAACAQEDSRVFVFRDDAQRLWHSGGHYMYYGPDGNIRYEASIRMPKLVEEGTDPEVFYPAYCVDENVSTVVGTRYERLNIEDGSYYSQQQARIIRSILEKG